MSIGEYDDGTLPPARVLLDVDCVVRWVDGQPFSFWIARQTRLRNPLWHLEGHTFDLHLRAGGFTQYLRRPPQHVRRQLLTAAERGGLSFDEQSFV